VDLHSNLSSTFVSGYVVINLGFF